MALDHRAVGEHELGERGEKTRRLRSHGALTGDQLFEHAVEKAHQLGGETGMEARGGKQGTAHLPVDPSQGGQRAGAPGIEADGERPITDARDGEFSYAKGP